MTELFVRASSQDQALLRRLCGLSGPHSAADARPDRIVVDAHVPARDTDIPLTAVSGRPSRP